MDKIGVGIITYKRPQYFRKLIATIPFNKVDEVVVINDDPTAPPCNCMKQHKEIINEENYGVGISKNKALQYLIEKGCNHLFLIEDDVEILDENVFDIYIKTARRSGLHHLQFGHVGGPLKKQIKGTRTYVDELGIQMYQNPQGSFTYYFANVIKKIGFIDPNYKNAFEHVDHEYQLINAGLLPAFWWFPDVKDSHKYLMITPGGATNSSITDQTNYNENVRKSSEYFIKKWGHFTNQIGDVSKEFVEERLNFIETNYSQKNLLNDDKKLAVIIPFRNRQQHLDQLLPELKNTLNKQNPNHKIFVIEQSGGSENGTGDWHDGDKPFNKGILFNAGVKMAKEEGFDYIILHDVDLIPECSDYGYPIQPTHLSYKVSQFEYKPQYDELFGGVFSISIDDYYKINGYTNDFWGWGKEDDDFFIRLYKQFPSISSSHIYYGKYKSLPHKSMQSLPDWIEKNNYGEKHTFTTKFLNNEVESKSGINNVKFDVIHSEMYDLYTKITIDF
jgi:GT2 family glycosyltransferase